MKEKKNKKKILFIALFLFAIAGVVGYGVYSYYFAQGTVAATSETITLDGFDVHTYGDGDQRPKKFLDGDMSTEIEEGLTCEYTDYEEFTCFGAGLELENTGSKEVEITISNLTGTVNGINGATLKSIRTTKSQNTYNLTPGDYDNFAIEAIVEVPGYVETQSSEATQVNSPVSGGDLEVSVSYTVTATEVHE